MSNGRRSYVTVPAPLARSRGRLSAAEEVCGCPLETAHVETRSQRDPIVGGSDPTRDRRTRQPHVEQVDQAPTGRQAAGQGFADSPDRPALDEDHIDQLTLSGHADRQRRPERDPRSGARGAIGGHQWKPCALEGRRPRLADLPLRESGRIGRPRDDQTPALARLGDGRGLGWSGRRLCGRRLTVLGRAGHVC